MNMKIQILDQNKELRIKIQNRCTNDSVSNLLIDETVQKKNLKSENQELFI
jgi:hypothetical protein